MEQNPSLLIQIRSHSAVKLLPLTCGHAKARQMMCTERSVCAHDL